MLQLKKDHLYSYGDYLSWPNDERWEIFEGVPYMMSPAPNPYHQEIVVELSRLLGNYLYDNKDKCCKLYVSPIDVILSENSLSDKFSDDDIFTVVQPDVLITCDLNKIDKRGHRGAPDFIVEVVSPSNASNDYIVKMNLYEKHGVKEYWIVDPQNRIVEVYSLQDDERYGRPEIYSDEDSIKLKTVDGLEVDLSSVFGEIVDE